jgi:cephalosporin hydroxylase
VVKTAGDPLFWARSRAEIRSLLRKHPTSLAPDVLAITKGYRGHGWYKRLSAFQVDEEFGRLADWATAQKPATVIEIGTASGATLFMWCRVATRQVVSIDLPGGIHGECYPEQKGRLFDEFLRDRPGVRLDLVRGSSHELQTKERVANLLGGAKADVLFIDGDHRLEGVTRDLTLFRDLVKPGGHIVLHDVLPHPHLESCQVHVLWDQLKREHPDRTWEIIASRDQGWAGIGILDVA